MRKDTIGDFRAFEPRRNETRPVLALGDPGIDRTWMRCYRWGAIFAVSWCITLPLFVAAGLMTAWGPFGWLNTWQLRTFGSNSVVVLVIPFVPLAFLPLIVARLSRIDQTRPFLLGARQAFDARWGPRISAGTDELQLRLRRTQRIGGGVALVGAVAALGFSAKAMHDGSAPHALLAEMSHAALTDPATPLPDAIRVTGVTADRSREWAHDYAVRRNFRHDVYFGLRPTGQPRAAEILLLELDRTNPAYGAEPWNTVDAPGPREGVPSVLDEWTAEQLRHAGFALADHVIVLDRQQLDGRSPYPDPITDTLLAILSFTLAFSGLMAFCITRRFGRTAAVS